MSNPWNRSISDSERQSDERERVREELEARLLNGGVLLTGTESDTQIVDLSDALEGFDHARALVGGDSMVNTRNSSRPDDERLVLPGRCDDESVEQYVGRVRAATERLRALTANP